MLLELDKLGKRFGGLQAVKDVSFTVDQGQIIGLIGPNGAGKTTAFNMIAGVYPPSSGDVRFEGRSIIGRSTSDICRLGIGRTFQITRPFNRLTVLDSTAVGALHWAGHVAAAREYATEVLHKTAIYHLRDRLGKELTVVQRKRLEVARALATKPKLLLLDEVCAGLPPGELPTLLDLIRKVAAEGVAVLMIEHVLQAVMSLASHINVLNFGQIIATGSPGEVVQNRAVIEAYLGEERTDAQG
jgi:branched-chain amino acid transport system ATP-binding protein